MPTFLQIGATYINVDRINKVDVVCDPSGAVVSAMVWLAGGGVHQLAGVDAQQIIAFIRQHKAN